MNSPAERITEYLSLGGLFNPEMMNHNAVSALLIDCRAELSRLSALVAELTKTGQIASRTPLDILGDQRIGVGVGQDGPYVTGPSSLSQLKDTTNADK